MLNIDSHITSEKRDKMWLSLYSCTGYSSCQFKQEWTPGSGATTARVRSTEHGQKGITVGMPNLSPLIYVHLYRR